MVKYFQQFLGYLAPPIVAVFLFGVFWRRANTAGALAALATGLGFGGVMIARGGHLAPFTDWHPFLYLPPLLFVLSSTALVGASLLTPAPCQPGLDRFVWTTRLYREETAELASQPWYRNYRVLSLLLLAVTVLFLVIWR